MRNALVSTCMCVLALGCGGHGRAATPAAPSSPPQSASAEARPDETRAPATETGAWGDTVSAPETEARVAAMLGRMRDGALEAGDLRTAVAFGPGLWSTWQLAGLGSSEGIPVVGRVRVRDRVVMAHGRAVRFDALAPFMASNAVRAMARHFADGEIAPATPEERQLYYMGIAWPIAGEPVTVVRKEDETLVVVLDEDGALFQLEILSPWYQLATGGESAIETYQPANPFPAP